MRVEKKEEEEREEREREGEGQGERERERKGPKAVTARESAFLFKNWSVLLHSLVRVRAARPAAEILRRVGVLRRRAAGLRPRHAHRLPPPAVAASCRKRLA